MTKILPIIIIIITHIVVMHVDKNSSKLLLIRSPLVTGSDKAEIRIIKSSKQFSASSMFVFQCDFLDCK